jgi:nicotinamidase-related amidase
MSVLPPARAALSLAQRVDPQHAALVTVDMQHDFCSPGGAAPKSGLDPAPLRALIPRIAQLQEQARAHGAALVHIKNAYNAPGNPYLSEAWLDQARRRWNGRYVETPMCVPGSWGAEILPEVAPREGELVVTKHRFSAFAGTDLDLSLRSRGIQTLIFCGCVTYVCVESTVRDAFFANYHIVVCEDAVAGWHPEWHRHSLEIMHWWFGDVVPSAEVMEAWEKTSVARR